MATSISQFSPEVLEEMFKHLPPSDLCRLALTNSKIRKAACNPKFFSQLGQQDWLKEKIAHHGMAVFLEQTRLQNIRQLDLSSTTFAPGHYNLLMEHIVNGGLKKLVKMNLGGVVLSGLDASNLSHALVRVKEVHVSGTQLTAQQCQQLMDTIVTVCPKLRKIKVCPM